MHFSPTGASNGMKVSMWSFESAEPRGAWRVAREYLSGVVDSSGGILSWLYDSTCNAPHKLMAQRARKGRERRGRGGSRGKDEDDIYVKKEECLSATVEGRSNH